MLQPLAGARRPAVRPGRALRLALLALATGLTCRDQSTTGPGLPSLARIAVAPSFTRAATAPIVTLATARISVVALPGGPLLKDTVATFATDGTPLSFVLSVVLTAPSQLVELRVAAATAAGDTVYRSRDQITVTANGAATDPVDVRLEWVAPDTAVKALRVFPRDTTFRTGDTPQFRVVAKRADSTVFANPIVGWTSSDPSLATFSADGRLTAKRTFTSLKVYAGLGSGLVDSTFVTAIAPVASVTLAPDSVEAIPNDTLQLTATLKAADGTILTGRDVAWSTPDANVSVNATGRVIASAVGTARVIAASEGKADTTKVVVKPAPVSSLALSADSLVLVRGDTARLVATLRDRRALVLTGRAVAWRSTGAGVTVDATGLVSAERADSTALVIAESEGKADTVPVRVTRRPVARVDVAPDTATLFVGTTRGLVATPRDASGAENRDFPVAWTTLDAAVATVTDAGVVSAVAPGATTIRATAGGVASDARIAVRLVPVATVVAAPGAVLLRVGTSAALTLATRDSAGGALSGRPVTWTSRAPAIATVDAAGRVAGAGVGETYVVAGSEGKLDSVRVTVTLVPIGAVVVSPRAASLVEGTESTIAVAVSDTAGGPLTDRAAAWSSSDAAVAAVDAATGRVRALAVGSAWVRAVVEGQKDSARVTVTEFAASCVSTGGTPHAGTVGTETWTRLGSPHRLTSTVTVAGGVLTVEPGAVVCAAPGASLVLDGARLLAAGTSTRRIRFAASDGASWGGLRFTGTPGDSSVVRHAIVEYAGVVGDTSKAAFWIGPQHLVTVESTTVRQAHELVAHVYSASRFRALRVDTATATVLRGSLALVRFAESADGAVLERSAMRAIVGDAIDVSAPNVRLVADTVVGSTNAAFAFFGANTLVQGLRADSSSFGVALDPTASFASGSTPPRAVADHFAFAGPLDGLVALYPSRAALDSLVSTGSDTVYVLGGALSAGRTAVVRPDLVLRYQGRVTVRGTLVAEPGARLRAVAGAGIVFTDGGRLEARGTAAQPITVTTFNPAARHAGLLFDGAPADSSYLRNVIVTRAGAKHATPPAGFEDGFVAIGSAGAHRLSMDSVAVSDVRGGAVRLLAPASVRRLQATGFTTDSLRFGVELRAGAAGSAVEGARVEGAGRDGIWVAANGVRLYADTVSGSARDGAWATGRGLVVRRNVLTGNHRHGLYAAGDSTITTAVVDSNRFVGNDSLGIQTGRIVIVDSLEASRNYWGSDGGPNGEGGDGVGDRVRFVPWLLNDMVTEAGSPYSTRSCAATGTLHTSVFANQTWTRDASPHHLHVENVEVVDGAVLTIEPGALVCADPGTALAFRRGGRLVARGTDALPIRFSAADTAAGWAGLVFTGAATDSSRIARATIEYGGRATNFTGFDGAVFVDAGHALAMDTVTVRQSAHRGVAFLFGAAGGRLTRVGVDTVAGAEYGLDLAAEGVRVEGSVVRQAGSLGIHVNASLVTLRADTVHATETGVALSGSARGVTLDGVRVFGGTNAGVSIAYGEGGEGTVRAVAEPPRVTGARVAFDGPITAFGQLYPNAAAQAALDGNVTDSVRIAGGVLDDFGARLAKGHTFVFRGTVVSADASLLTAEAGARLLFEPTAGLRTSGNGLIHFDGTETDSVHVTATDTTAGWRGIELTGTTGSSGSRLAYAHVAYGGVSTASTASGAIAIRAGHSAVVEHTRVRNARAQGVEVADGAGSVTLRHLLVEDAGSDGVELSQSGASLDTSVVRRSGGSGVLGWALGLRVYGNEIANSAGAGLRLGGAPSAIARNRFLNNDGAGVTLFSITTARADTNYWGDDDGPNGLAGDGVGAGVAFSPWLRADGTLDSTRTVVVHDAAADFSTTTNPMAGGRWRAGWTPTLGGPLTLLSTYVPSTRSWRDPAIDAIETPAYGRNDTSAPVNGTPVGMVFLHAACHAHELAVLRYTAAESRRYAVEARWLPGDLGESSAHVLRNGRAEVTLFTHATTSDSPVYRDTLRLTAGEFVDFALGDAGDCFGDTTPLSVTFTPLGAITAPDAAASLVSTLSDRGATDAAQPGDSLEIGYTMTIGGTAMFPFEVVAGLRDVGSGAVLAAATRFFPGGLSGGAIARGGIRVAVPPGAAPGTGYESVVITDCRVAGASPALRLAACLASPSTEGEVAEASESNNVARAPFAVSAPGLASCADVGTVHSGTITSNQLWTRAASPHHVNGYLDVTGGGTVLTVESGALVCGAPDGALEISSGARLDARGTASESIVFTARDTTVGWGGIGLRGAASDSSRVANAIVAFASLGANADAGIAVARGHRAALDGVRIRRTAQASLLVNSDGAARLATITIDSSATVGASPVVIRGDGTVVDSLVVRASRGDAVSLTANNVRLSRVALLGGDNRAIGIGGGAIGTVFDRVRISGFAGGGILASAGSTAGAGSNPPRIESTEGRAYLGEPALFVALYPDSAAQDSLRGNPSGTGVELTGSGFSPTLTTPLVARAGVPLTLGGTIKFSGAGARFEARPGASVLMGTRASVVVNGGARVVARGTATLPVTIDAADAAFPWRGFELRGTPSDSSFFTNVLVAHGSEGGTTDGAAIATFDAHPVAIDSAVFRGMLGDSRRGVLAWVPGARVSRTLFDSVNAPLDLAGAALVERNEMRHGGIGVFVSGTGIVLRDNDVHDNTGDALSYNTSTHLPATISNNRFVNNGGVGVNNAGSQTLDARYNYWGGELGPLGSGGDGVAGSVLFDPWLKADGSTGTASSFSTTSCSATGTIHGTAIGASETWTKAASPHQLPGLLNVSGAATVLTVEPGALVCAAPDVALRFAGGARLDARGTAADTVVFTARDTTAGWGGIGLYDAASDSSRVAYALVAYPGRGAAAAEGGFALSLGHRLALDHVRVRRSGQSAISTVGTGGARLSYLVVDSAATPFAGDLQIRTAGTVLDSVVVRATAADGISIVANDVRLSRVAVIGSGGSGQRAISIGGGLRLVLDRVRVSGSGGGGLVIDPSVTVGAGSTPPRVESTARYAFTGSPAVFAALYPDSAAQDSLLGNPSGMGVRLVGGTVAQRLVARAGVPLQVDTTITFDGGLASLDARPGADVRVADRQRLAFTNGARLVARGSADAPARFTAIDTVSTRWGGFELRGAPESGSILRNAVVSYAGGSDAPITTGAAIWVPTGESHTIDVDSVRFRRIDNRAALLYGGAPSFRRSTFDTVGTTYSVLDLATRAQVQENTFRGGANGVYANAASIAIRDNTFADGLAAGVYVTASGIATTIAGNSFLRNTSVGVANASGGTVDARDNYWGDDAGPNGPNGDGVSANVLFDPWRKADGSSASSFSTASCSVSGTPVPASVTSSAFWTKAGSPYKLAGTTTFTGPLLTVEPGALVCAAPGAELVLDGGRLVADGTLSARTRFTATDPASGWGGLRFKGLPSDRSLLRQAVVEYAGTTAGAAVRTEGLHPVLIDTSTIRQSRGPAVRDGTGIWLHGARIDTVAVDPGTAAVQIEATAAAADIRGLRLRRSGGDGIAVSAPNVVVAGDTVIDVHDSGLLLYGANPQLVGVRIDSATTGIFTIGVSTLGAGSTPPRVVAAPAPYLGPVDYFLKLYPTRAAQDSLAYPAGAPIVNFFAGTVPSGSTLAARGDIPWRLLGTVTVQGTVAAEPGAVVIADATAGLTMNGGRLLAVGTPANRVRFTASTPVSGWRGLVFDGSPSDSSVVRHATIEYAGVKGDTSSAALRTAGSHLLSLDSSVVRQSFESAVRFATASRLRATHVDTVVATTGSNAGAVTLINGAASAIVERSRVRGVDVAGLFVQANPVALVNDTIVGSGTFRNGVTLLAAEGSLVRGLSVDSAGAGGIVLSTGIPTPTLDPASTPPRVAHSGVYAFVGTTGQFLAFYPTRGAQDSLVSSSGNMVSISGTIASGTTLAGRADLAIRSNSGLTVNGLLQLEPGAALSLGGNAKLTFAAGGRLDARGTAARPVAITAATASRYAGLFFLDSPSDSSYLRNVVFSGAGAKPLSPSTGFTDGFVAVGSNGSHPLSMDSVVFTDVRGGALRLLAPARVSRVNISGFTSDTSRHAIEVFAPATIEASTVVGARLAAIRVGASGVAVRNDTLTNGLSHGLLIDSSSAVGTTIAGNAFVNNAGNGVDRAAGVSGTIDARDNYWGSDAGPLSTGGDGVGASVLYEPWRNAAGGSVASALRTWNGSASTAWTDAANWTPPIVPGTGDTAYVPAGPARSPSIGAVTTIGGLRVDDGAAVSVADGAVLAVAGSAQMGSTGGVTGPGAQGGLLALVGGGTVRGRARYLELSGPYTATGAVLVDSTLSIAGTLDANGQTIAVHNLITNAAEGAEGLVMTHAADSVDVGGSAIFAGGSTAGHLTAGTLVLRGEFVQNGASTESFAASAGHRTVFAGASTQPVVMLKPGPSHFGQLVTTNGLGGVRFGTNVHAVGAVELDGSVTIPDTNLVKAYGDLAVKGTVVNSGRLQYCGTLIVLGGDVGPDSAYSCRTPHHARVVPDSVNLAVGASATLAASVRNAADSTLAPPPIVWQVLDAGIVSFDAGTGTVTGVAGGRARIQVTIGTLVDTAVVRVADVPGAVVSWTGAGANDLWSSPANWSPARTPTLADTAYIGFAASTGKVPRLPSAFGVGSLVLEPNAAMLMGLNELTIHGSLDVGAGASIGYAGAGYAFTLASQTGLATLRGRVPAPLQVNGKVTLAGDARVAGSLRIVNGENWLDVGGHTLTIDSSLYVDDAAGGRLRMTRARDSVIVGESALFGSPEDSEGWLTDGTLIVNGSFRQLANAQAFVAGPNHRTEIAGTDFNIVRLDDPTTTRFGTLVLRNAGDVSKIQSNAVVLDTLVVRGVLEIPAGVLVRTRHFRGYSGALNLYGALMYCGGTYTPGPITIGPGPDAPVSCATAARVVNATRSLTLSDGQQFGPLGVTAYNAADSVLTRTPTFTASAPFVASVDAAGVITAQGSGTGLVIATVDGRADTTTVTVVLPTPGPSGTNSTWRGTVNGNWSNPFNWSNNLVPNHGDVVWIPRLPMNAPRLDVDGKAVAGLALEDGASLDLAGRQLTVYGNYDGRTASIATGASPGRLVLMGRFDDNTGTVKGNLPTTELRGDYTLSGALRATGQLMVASSGWVRPAGRAIDVEGLVLSGHVAMTAADSLTATGYVQWNPSTPAAGALAGGVVVLRGSAEFSVAEEEYGATSSHRFVAAGEGMYNYLQPSAAGAWLNRLEVVSGGSYVGPNPYGVLRVRGDVTVAPGATFGVAEGSTAQVFGTVRLNGTQGLDVANLVLYGALRACGLVNSDTSGDNVQVYAPTGALDLTCPVR